DRRANVFDLGARILELTRLHAAFAEVAMIEGERGETPWRLSESIEDDPRRGQRQQRAHRPLEPEPGTRSREPARRRRTSEGPDAQACARNDGYQRSQLQHATGSAHRRDGG